MNKTLCSALTKMQGSIRLQYGCGLSAPSNWLNFDASPLLYVRTIPVLGIIARKLGTNFPSEVIYGDITKHLPLPDMSCQLIYASHVLEHLSLSDLHRALDETYRLLRPNGTFRAVVPDLQTLAHSYLKALSEGDRNASITFMKDSYLGKEIRAYGIRYFLREWLGNSNHLWMWDFFSLEGVMLEHGFCDIRRASFNDSEHMAFREVEDIGRFAGACAVEARRP